MRLDETELSRWGERIGRTMAAPAVLTLSGPLGAGKSVLARAIGRGAGVDEAMPSPSYNLLFRYSTPTDVEVVHVDLYRIESTDELWELGWSELGTHSDIVVIEWPERAGEFLPPDRWHIDLSIPDEHGTLRDVEVRRVGDPPDLAAFPLSVSATS